MSVTSSPPEQRALGRLGARRGRRLSPWLLLPVALTLVAAGLGVWQLTRSAAPAAATTTATVSRGALSVSVAGSGTVAAAQIRALSFTAAGTVSEVLVAVGDPVVAGQPLARISTTELALALRQAEANLKSAEAQVAAANGQGATPAEIAAAAAQLRSAQAQYEQTVGGDTTAAELAAAEAQLASAQAQLAELQAGPTAAALAAAQAAVEQARLGLEAQRGSLAAAKLKAESAVATAANGLRDAQDSYSTIYWQNRQLEKAPGDLPQSNQDNEAAAKRAVANAEESYKQAQLAYAQAQQDELIGLRQAEAELASAERELATLVEPPTAAELAGARASVASAQASLAALREGASAAERVSAETSLEQARINLEQLTAPGSAATIAGAEASLAQAQVALAQARLDLENASLTAPFAGVVAEVLATVGATADGSATVTVIDPADLYVELSLSENDVAGVAVGQIVELGFDALPDVVLSGTVKSVAPTATVSSNVATYPVRISFSPGEHPVRVGMTASGTIVTEERVDALLVPTRAVTTRGNAEMVLLQQGEGQPPRPVRVVTGLASDGQTEILGCAETGNQCLAEGDTLLIRTTSTTGSSQSSNQPGLGGLGGPGGGGPPPGGFGGGRP